MPERVAVLTKVNRVSQPSVVRLNRSKRIDSRVTEHARLLILGTYESRVAQRISCRPQADAVRRTRRAPGIEDILES